MHHCTITFLNLKKADPTESIIHVQCTCNFIQKIIQNLPFQGQTQLKGGQYCKILICYQEILLMFDYYNTYVNAVPKKKHEFL